MQLRRGMPCEGRNDWQVHQGRRDIQSQLRKVRNQWPCVNHTPKGSKLLRMTDVSVDGCPTNWEYSSFVDLTNQSKMCLAIPPNVYARVYGNAVYLFNQTTWASVLIKDAAVFKDLFSRTPTSTERIVKEIVAIHRQPHSCVKSDLNELITPLIHDGFLLCGKTVSTVPTQPSFANYSQQQHLNQDDAENDQSSTESPEDTLYEYFRDNPTPFELDIDLTQACTERCIHCYAASHGTKSLELSVIEKAFGEFRAMGGLKVKLTGGECMLHKNFIDTLQMARAHDFVISVLSNLTECNDINQKAMKATNVAVVQTSLYGADAQTHETITQRTGSFSQTMKAIEALSRLGIQVQIHCPIMRQNLHAIGGVEAIGKRFGIKTTFDAAIMARANHDNSNLECSLSDDMLCQFLKKQGVEKSACKEYVVVTSDTPICNIGIARICLSATGIYYPCSGCYGFALGDCSQMTLAEVWNGEKMTRLRSISFKELSKCRSCKLLAYCNVCPARNYNATQDLFTPDPMLCRIARIKHKLASGETEI